MNSDVSWIGGGGRSCAFSGAPRSAIINGILCRQIFRAFSSVWQSVLRIQGNQHLCFDFLLQLATRVLFRISTILFYCISGKCINSTKLKISDVSHQQETLNTPPIYGCISQSLVFTLSQIYPSNSRPSSSPCIWSQS